MQNHRARERSQTHAPRPAPELTSWEDIRATLPVDHPRLVAAYDRLSEAESVLYERWEQQSGTSEIEGDPVGLLLGHPVIPENGDEMLWIMGLGEKVAALGGHLEVQAVFQDEQLTLITEPGSEGQPPLTERAMDLAVPAPPPEPGLRSTGEVDVDLTGEERALLVSGLVEWSRAAPLTDPLAIAMGFASREDFEVRLLGLAYELRYGEPLIPEDWRRALAATEIGIATDYHSAAPSWQDRTGLTDPESLALLRSAQRKLAPVIGRRVGASGSDAAGSD